MTRQHSVPDEATELFTLVEEMAKAQTVDEITRIWSADFTWFDVAHCIVRGREAAYATYAEQFSVITNLRTEILDVKAFADGSVGFVHSVQRFLADGINGGGDVDIVFRQSDGFVKRDDEWQLVHQHVSLPFDPATGVIVTNSPV